MKTLVILLSLFMTTPALAKPPVENGKLANFQPGNYSLEKGELKLCGDGDFALRDNNSNVELGPHHGFDTSAKSEAMPGDAEGDENCVYFVNDSVEVMGTETRLGFTEERKCKEKTMHVLTKKVVIQAEIIKLDVKQDGEGKNEYSCTWKLKKKLKK